MKKLKIVLLILCILLVSGCSSKNNKKDENKDTDKNQDPILEVNKFTVTYDVEGEKTLVEVEENKPATYLNHPEKSGYDFLGWFKDDELFDFSTSIIEDITLKAKFEKTKIRVTYDFGYDCYRTKADLRQAYYKDFYDFLVSKEAPELEQEGIKSFGDFMEFMLTWEIHKGRGELYHTGDAFKEYYVCNMPGTGLEDQPDTHFIGWCYKNNKYVNFINFLAVFFAYWRTDEGYTANSGDPNGNDFYAHSWSSLVDTAKFFYFTADTLNIKYPWFNSERVKDALDNIPGVGRVSLEYESDIQIRLPNDIRRDGYRFAGWYDDNNERISMVKKSTTVHAKWVLSEILDTLSSDFMKDFNTISGRNLKYNEFDTHYLNSSEFVDMVNNQEMYNKWLWFFELLAELSGDETINPNQESYNWNANKGFYLSNICGLFTCSKHTDSNLFTVSLDYSDPDLMDQALKVIEEHYK